MKITIKKISAEEEDEVIIRCHHLSPNMMRVIAALEAQNVTLTVYDGTEIFRLEPEDVFYIESVDKKTFVYSEDRVFESKSRLYEMEEVLRQHDFFRASRSMLVNLRRVHSFSTAVAGRFEAIMQNDEKIIISRWYVNELKKFLKI